MYCSLIHSKNISGLEILKNDSIGKDLKPCLCGNFLAPLGYYVLS